jgi:hypothetical protein
VPIVLKSGSLNLLEPSGPVQACNGTALPFTVVLTLTVVILFSSGYDGLVARISVNVVSEEVITNQVLKVPKRVDVKYKKSVNL